MLKNRILRNSSTITNIIDPVLANLFTNCLIIIAVLKNITAILINFSKTTQPLIVTDFFGIQYCYFTNVTDSVSDGPQ